MSDPAADALARSTSVLVLVDFQARLAPAIHSIAGVMTHANALLDGAALLDVPVVLTEHCADAIGGTVPSLSERAPQATIVSKVHFDATREDRLIKTLEPMGRMDVVVGGIEAHVCVLQTALGLIRAGYRVWLARDATGSRKPSDHAAAQERLCAAGARLVTTEMVLFEWLDRGDADAFRALLPTIKGLDQPVGG